MSAILRVREAFAVNDRGVARVLRPGDLIDESDPIVAGRGHLFEPVEAAAVREQDLADEAAGRKPGGVEQATAEPGEKRSRTRPRASRG